MFLVCTCASLVTHYNGCGLLLHKLKVVRVANSVCRAFSAPGNDEALLSTALIFWLILEGRSIVNLPFSAHFESNVPKVGGLEVGALLQTTVTTNG